MFPRCAGRGSPRLANQRPAVTTGPSFSLNLIAALTGVCDGQPSGGESLRSGHPNGRLAVTGGRRRGGAPRLRTAHARMGSSWAALLKHKTQRSAGTESPRLRVGCTVPLHGGAPHGNAGVGVGGTSKRLHEGQEITPGANAAGVGSSSWAGAGAILQQTAPTPCAALGAAPTAADSPRTRTGSSTVCRLRLRGHTRMVGFRSCLANRPRIHLGVGGRGRLSPSIMTGCRQPPSCRHPTRAPACRPIDTKSPVSRVGPTFGRVATGSVCCAR